MISSRGQRQAETVTLTATVVGFRNDGWDLDGRISDDTDAADGEIRMRVSDTARVTYGLEACADEVERRINTLPPKVRLDVAVKLGKWGAFKVVTTEVGPFVIFPEPSAELLAA